MNCDRCWLDGIQHRALFRCEAVNLCLSHAKQHRRWGHRPRLLVAVARRLLKGEW